MGWQARCARKNRGPSSKTDVDRYIDCDTIGDEYKYGVFPQVFRIGNRHRPQSTTASKMAQETHVHVVNKANNLDHHTIPTNTSHLPRLAQNTIRLRPRLISLTTNNLTYARLGSLANWWDAFPVPSFLPSPYNNPSTYGIVPVWGYAEITTSRTPGLEPGTIFYGFWPSSTLPVDLQLTPTEPSGHFIDTTPHRANLWSYYHRYTVTPSPLDFSSPSLAREIVFKPLFECAHALNTYILGALAIHPAPLTNASQTWPALGDLSNTALISLSASGKTARAFSDAVLNARPPETGPAVFVAVTSNPSTLTFPTSTTTRVLSYTSPLPISLLNSPSITRILLLDFGAPSSYLSTLLSSLPSNPITFISIGASPSNPLDPSDSPNRIQMNTSEVREAAINAIGANSYFKGVEAGWRDFCAREGCQGVEVQVGRGVRELEEAWKDLCEGTGVGGGRAVLL
jgi:hypothetical protein